MRDQDWSCCDGVQIQVDVTGGRFSFTHLDDCPQALRERITFNQIREKVWALALTDCPSGWSSEDGIPDGTYIVDFDRNLMIGGDEGRVVELQVELKREPAIPVLLEVLSLSLSRFTLKSIFEPSYLDLQNAYIRGRQFDGGGRLVRGLRAVAFGAHAARIVLECLVRDWLTLSWRQFIWLVITLIAGGGVARWLFGL
jgi:hypothetical protein